MSLGFDPALAFGWSAFAGFVMSMGVGGGGILAGIGHISILGIADPNMIKVVNQIMEFSSRIVSVPLYHRQRRLVWSVAVSYGLGAPIGASLGAWFSRTRMADMAAYRSAFGILIVLVAARVLYESWGAKALDHPGRRKASDASSRAARSARASAAAANGPDSEANPHSTLRGWNAVRVRFGGDHFDFSPVTTAAGGFVISFVGSAFGVGGGFLTAPFMASVLLFPMYLVVGTSLVALFIPLAVSIATYIALRVGVDWWLVAVEVPGVLVGSFVGPWLNRHMNERALKTSVAVALVAIGLFYVLH
jgi:uncharacterized membrane protein YfcA